MFPVLHSDDFVYFKKISFNNLKVNDIVFILNKKNYLIHRVLYKTTNYIITKGDNNLLADKKTHKKYVLGLVYQIKRNNQIISINDIYLIQSTLYFKEIVKIKKNLEINKINFVFLKGLPLHLYYEGKHPQRLYADCDILIEKDSLKKVEKILFKQGFKKNLQLNNNFEKTYYKMIGDFIVVFDVHLKAVFLMTQIDDIEVLYSNLLVERFTKELLNNKQRLLINQEVFFIPNNQYLIIYLALHFFHHNFKGIYRLILIDKIIRKYHLKWEEIFKKIDEYQINNFVFPVFLLLKKYFKTPIPNMKTIGNSNVINNLSVFDSETRLQAGVNRFKNIFFLSPRPLLLKMLVFFNPKVIYFILFFLKQKLFSLLKKT